MSGTQGQTQDHMQDGEMMAAAAATSLFLTGSNRRQAALRIIRRAKMSLPQ